MPPASARIGTTFGIDRAEPSLFVAFRQQVEIHADAAKAGVQPGDVIIGMDGLAMEMSRTEFFGHIRRNFLVGDKITLDVIRNGKQIGLPITLQ